MYNNVKVSYGNLNLIKEIYRANERISYNPPILNCLKLNTSPMSSILDYFREEKDCIVFINLPGSFCLKELKALRELREVINLNANKFKTSNVFIKTRKSDIEDFLCKLTVERDLKNIFPQEVPYQANEKTIYLIDTFDYGVEKELLIRKFKELAELTSKKVVELNFSISEEYLETKLDLISKDLNITFNKLEKLIIIETAMQSHDKFENILCNVLNYKALGLFPSSAYEILELIEKGRKYDQITKIINEK